MSNYTKVLEEVKALNKDVLLLSVSKTHPYSVILDAYNEGARCFGENRVQEALAKFPETRPEDMRIYLIGQLQSNKVKKAVAFFDRIESVDSIKLLEKINTESGRINKTMDILLEFNSSGEENKSGFRSEEDVLEALKLIPSLKNIHLLGLMTVGPLGGDREKNLKAFSKTKELYDRINEIHPISVLSMGMSGDYKDAIASGSTEVRIGSAIFGERV